MSSAYRCCFLPTWSISSYAQFSHWLEDHSTDLGLLIYLLGECLSQVPLLRELPLLGRVALCLVGLLYSLDPLLVLPALDVLQRLLLVDV